ncbi:MAG: cytochrome c biogenesis protein CcsA [Bacteroidia bacterium]|nr:cytochrome c biogenesis protein CcsA [Bacteroidia bacterium]
MGGKLGELFVALAFGAALTSLIALLKAETEADAGEKRKWERLGLGAFLTHALSILGVVLTLFLLIYFHQYQYHYVWAHSSNELPVHFMISCFWEGQEGSFLLWCFWHSLLGVLLMRKPGEWRNLVIAILASIELILSSMLLGVYLPAGGVQVLYAVMILAPGAYLAWRYARQRSLLPDGGVFHLAGLMLALMAGVLLLRGQLGFGLPLLPGAWTFGSLDGAAFWLFGVFFLSVLVLYVRQLVRTRERTAAAIWDQAAGLLLLAVAVAGALYSPDTWKIGSTPFLSLKAAFPDDPAFAQNPDFVPTNGSGLNPLLQNYWMVIHPPTLFLGFASTAIPFAFVMAGLIRGKYDGWIKPSLPWTSFSVMILGVGIIMGGYWAYETLNFGGYWNWDPVENSSFVPWLCGVASLHAMLIYRKAKTYLKLTMLLIISTFLLVLYSTFLTRSGILGETSVHTFTDLGLSGQLLILVAMYLAFVAVAMAFRWRELPQREDESKVWSAEFMLFMGVLIFSFAGLVIILTTSLPVFNSIFGTDFAPPAKTQLFYYQWTVWFAALFGVVSGIGQFLWWKMGEQKRLADALFRPFLAAVISGSAILIGLMVSKMTFAYDAEFAAYISPEATGSGFIGKALGYVKFGIMAIADELLLYSALFGLFANLDVLIALIRRNRKGLKIMGGTVVHLGFALMLMGMLFSSGYDQVISKNLMPADLAGFPEQERVDNVRLPRGYAAPIQGYDVTYIGRKEARPPVSGLRVLETRPDYFRLSFRDSTGERFMLDLPWDPFVARKADGSQPVHPTADVQPASSPYDESELDFAAIEELLNRNLDQLNPRRNNNRTLYGLTFTSREDREHQFTIYPEAELNEQEKNILPHPARKIYWNRDIYVFTSSLPSEETAEPKYYNLSLRQGDTVMIGGTILQLLEVRNLSGIPQMQQYDVAAAAHVAVFAGQDTFLARPVFVIKDRAPGMISDAVQPLGMELAFVGVEPEENLIKLQLKYTDPRSDFVVIKAISKPFINLLWLGTFILTAGFMISIWRRVQELRSGPAKESV